MQCNEVMSREVEVLGIDQPVHMAAAIMRDTDVGFLPVCDSERKVVGTLTDRDIAVRLVAAQRNSDTPVRDIMSSEVISVRPENDLHEAEGLMRQNQVSRLVCVDASGTLVGVLGMADLARRDDASHVQQTVKSVKSDAGTFASL
jgi:CBS domain-containing protein